MKNLLIILVCLVCLTPTSFAKDSIWTLLSAELELAVDWSSTNPEMQVFSLDKDYNYQPFQENRGNESMKGQNLVFEHIYENIDLFIKPLESGKTCYEFVVYPGGDLSQIKLLKKAFLRNELFMAKDLLATQDHAGEGNHQVEVRMKKQGQGLGFEVGSYEVAQALTISFIL